MFLKKTPKPKGTYLAITESYYDKEKKATRQKTIMGLGYLEDLRQEYPDPIAHFEKVVADMNLERETKKNSVVYVDLTCPLNPDELSLKNVGYGILKHIYKELQLDIFWRTKTWNLSLPYNIEEIFRFLVISQIMYPDASWADTLDMSAYFEASQELTPENVNSALDILAKYQKDIQKWIYEHSSALFQRDYSLMCLDHSSYSFSYPEDGDSTAPHAVSRKYTRIQLDLLTDQNGIPIAYDTFSGQESLVQAISQAVRWIKRNTPDIHILSTASHRPLEKTAAPDFVPVSGYIYGQPVQQLDNDFKEWILKDDYHQIILDNIHKRPISLQCKERICQNQEKQIVFYHELQARQQSLLRQNAGRRSGRKLDGYSAIVTSELQANSRDLFLLFHGIRHIESCFCKALDNYNSSPFFNWDQNRISGFFSINFTAITLVRLLQAKLDFSFSMAQIVSSLQKYNCVQIARNIYQFTYYDEILDSCEKNLGLELHNKYSNLIQIRRLLRY